MFNVYADGQSIYFPLDEALIINKPKLTLEMGKAGSFEFAIPPTNRFYSRLQKLKTIITVEYDGVEIFRGRVLTNNRGFNNIRKIYCEGDLAYLVDSVQKGEKYTGTTHDLFRRIIDKHNSRVDDYKKFTVGNITIDNREIFIAGSSDDIKDVETNKFDYKQIAINSIVDDWSTSLDYIVNTIIDYCGGYLRTRRVGSTTYIDMLKDYGRTSIQKIEFGRNLIDLTEEVKAEDLYTVLIPLGDDNLTIAKVNNGSDELVDEAGVARYGRIVKTNVFDSVNKAETLLENGRRMLENHENMPITITVKAVDMHMVDNSAGFIYVGDRVYVNSIPHDITEYLTCTKIEYDFENHGNDTYTFGNPKQTMTERYKKDKEKSSKRGHSGGGSGGVGAAADEAAQDYAISEADKVGKEIFDAWINVDPAAGKISLGALYAQVQNDREVFKNQVGIDLDAPAGTVDIYSMNTKLNTQGTLISQSEARIQTLANDQLAQIKEFAQFKTDTTNSFTSITQKVTKDEASIELLTKHDSANTSGLASLTTKVNDQQSTLKTLTEFNTKTSQSLTSITQTANDNKSNISILAQRTDANNKSIASISLTVKDMESTIAMKADTITMEGKILDAKKVLRAEFDTIVANKISSSFVSSGTITATNLSATKNLNVGLGITTKSLDCSGGASFGSTVYVGKKPVATQEWVNNQLNNYALKTHRHTVAIGHKHTVKVGATTYDTSNIAAGTSATRTTSAAV